MVKPHTEMSKPRTEMVKPHIEMSKPQTEIV